MDASLFLVLRSSLYFSRKKSRRARRFLQKRPEIMARALSPPQVWPPLRLCSPCVMSQSHAVVACPADTGSASSASLAQRFPFPAFPLRAPLAPLALGPVQAAAPPAEYHSDSAESLEEMPMVLAKLGSSLTVAEPSRSSLRTVSAFPPQSPHPRTKRKAPACRSNRSAGELLFELSSTRAPAVFVSRASGDPATARQDELTAAQRQTGFL